jgi:hypothetical protein
MGRYDDIDPSDIDPETNRPYVAIPLTRGYVAIVDAHDHERLAVRSWQAQVVKGKVYACASFRAAMAAPDVQKLYLHREVVDAPFGALVRFRNGDTMDCRRANLIVHPATRRTTISRERA